MQPLIFMVADAATIDSVGKINMLGAGITSLSPSEVPAAYKLFIVACIRFSPFESGNHKFSWTILDPDAKFLMPPFKDNHVSGEGYSVIPTFIEVVVKFPKFGRYQAELAIDSFPSISWTIDLTPLGP